MRVAGLLTCWHVSTALNDKSSLVVDAVFFIALLPILVLFYCKFQNRVTDFLGRSVFVFTDNSFDLPTILLVTAVINPVCIKENDVAGAHQSEFRHVRGVHLLPSEFHGEILITVGVILRYFQPQS